MRGQLPCEPGGTEPLRPDRHPFPPAQVVAEDGGERSLLGDPRRDEAGGNRGERHQLAPQRLGQGTQHREHLLFAVPRHVPFEISGLEASEQGQGHARPDAVPRLARREAVGERKAGVIEVPVIGEVAIAALRRRASDVRGGP